MKSFLNRIRNWSQYLYIGLLIAVCVAAILGDVAIKVHHRWFGDDIPFNNFVATDSTVTESVASAAEN